jgi:hypothetical protein
MGSMGQVVLPTGEASMSGLGIWIMGCVVVIVTGVALIVCIGVVSLARDMWRK